jgi:hypothetical protein
MSYDALDAVVASEHEIDGEGVLSRWARIPVAQHLGSASDRDHQASRTRVRDGRRRVS